MNLMKQPSHNWDRKIFESAIDIFPFGGVCESYETFETRFFAWTLELNPELSRAAISFKQDFQRGFGHV